MSLALSPTRQPPEAWHRTPSLPSPTPFVPFTTLSLASWEGVAAKNDLGEFADLSLFPGVAPWPSLGFPLSVLGSRLHYLLISVPRVKEMDRWRHDRYALILRITWLLALPFLFIGATSGWHGRDALEGTWRANAAILGSLLLTAAVFLSAHRRIKQIGSSARRIASTYQPHARWLFRHQEQSANTAQVTDTDRVLAFIEMLIDPAKHRTRTIETISLKRRTIHQHVSVEYSLPITLIHLNSSMAYVPILVPPKGELIDAFHLSNADNTSLCDLSYQETMELISFALQLLMNAAYSPKTKIEQAIENATELSSQIYKLSRKVYGVEAGLLTIIAERGRVPITKKDVDTCLDELDEATKRDASVDDVNRLKRFVLRLATTYPIVAAIPLQPGQERILVKYDRTIIPGLSVATTNSRLRLRLGLHPYQIGIPISLARASRSYHLQVEGPTDQYLMEQDLRPRHFKISPSYDKDDNEHSAISSTEEAEPDNTADSRDYFPNRRSRYGQSYAHLYIQGYANSGLRDLEFLVKFGDITPGILGRAVIASGAVASLVWLVGILLSNNSNSFNGSDVPALVLALPAIAVSWFGFVSSDEESMLRSSLAARGTLIISGLLSVLSVALYMAKSKALAPDSLNLLDNSLSLLGITDRWWGLLFLASSINLLHVTSRFVIRSKYYRALVLRRRHLETDYRMD